MGIAVEAAAVAADVVELGLELAFTVGVRFIVTVGAVVPAVEGDGVVEEAEGLPPVAALANTVAAPGPTAPFARRD